MGAMMGVTSLAAVAAFNLVCTGMLSTESLPLGKQSRPYTVVYRVDLDAKKWCDGECKGTHPIYEVQPGFLKLEEPQNVDGPSERKYFDSQIDRAG